MNFLGLKAIFFFVISYILQDYAPDKLNEIRFIGRLMRIFWTFAKWREKSNGHWEIAICNGHSEITYVNTENKIID